MSCSKLALSPLYMANSTSLCQSVSSFKLSNEARERIATMTRTNNGFDIAEADLKLRGPGNIEGTQQSGILNFKIADIAKDGRILQTARELAARILDQDPKLEQVINQKLRHYLDNQGRKFKAWSMIS